MGRARNGHTACQNRRTGTTNVDVKFCIFNLRFHRTRSILRSECNADFVLAELRVSIAPVSRFINRRLWLVRWREFA